MRIYILSGIVAATLLLLIACQSPEGASADAIVNTACGQAEGMMQHPDTPEGILLQVLLINADDREGGYRIYSDGRYESLVLGESWQAQPALTPQQLESARAAIADIPWARLRPLYQPEAPIPEGDSNTLWVQTIDNAGTLHSIAVVSPCQVPEIEALTAKLVAIFKDSAEK